MSKINNTNYISIEGLEGAGKSTAMKAIEDHYTEKQNGLEIIKVREPGGTVLAEKMRDLVKAEFEDENVTAKTELLLFFGARDQLLANKVIPELGKGNIVLSDRCYLSSVAYQRKEKNLMKHLIDDLRVKPSLIIYMDIDPILGLQRAKRRGQLDRIEKKELDFFQEARKVYQHESAKNDFIVTVDASKTIEEVYKAVRKEMVAYDRKLELKKKLDNARKSGLSI